MRIATSRDEIFQRRLLVLFKGLNEVVLEDGTTNRTCHRLQLCRGKSKVFKKMKGIRDLWLKEKKNRNVERLVS